jgi:hypothetical protein
LEKHGNSMATRGKHSEVAGSVDHGVWQNAAVACAWAVEAELRVDQIERGEVKLLPGEQVFEKIWRRYGGRANMLRATNDK